MTLNERKEEIKEIVTYALERNIHIIPEIDMPGHQLAALATYPELGCTGGPYDVWGQWGVADDVICAGNEKSMQFLEDVLSEVIDLFPSEYIHVGEMPEMPSSHQGGRYQGGQETFRRGIFAKLRDLPHGEICGEQRTPYHRLGRDPRRRLGPECHGNELERHGWRYRGRQAKA